MLAGINNCMFLVPMKPVHTMCGIAYTSSNDSDSLVPAEITEDRHKVHDNYKITLSSIYKRFGKNHYYFSDLKLLIDDGTVQFFVKHKS